MSAYLKIDHVGMTFPTRKGPLEVLNDVTLHIEQGELVSLFYEHGFVEREEHQPDGTHLVGRLPVELAGRYSTYWYGETE